MRLEVMTGTENLSLNWVVTQVNAALGTFIAIVGTWASCHPIPVLIIVTPELQRACPSFITS